MPANSVSASVDETGGGALPSNVDRLHVKLGCSSSGTVGALVSCGDESRARSTFTSGPLARAVLYTLAATTKGVAPKPLLAMRVAAAAAGYCGPVRTARVGSSTGAVTVAGAAYDRHQVQIEITASGILGTARARYSLDGGSSFTSDFVVPAGGTYVLAGTNVTVTFGSGSYDDGDFFYFRTVAPQHDATTLAAAFAALVALPEQQMFLVHVVGAPQPALSAVVPNGTSPPTVTVSGTPADYWSVVVQIILGGARGTATFQYSLDGGVEYNGTDLLTAATYVIPETGITLNFPTGTDYNADNEYEFDSGNSAQLDELYNAAKDGTEDLIAAYRYTRCVIEAPDAPVAKLTAASALLAESSPMVIAAGECQVRSTDARRERRSSAWPIVARVCATSPGEFAGKVNLGPLSRVDQTYYDEGVEGGTLKSAGFATLRKWIGKGGGVYIEDIPTRRAPTSTIKTLLEARLADVAQRVGRQSLLDNFQGEEFRVEAHEGADAAARFLIEEEAVTIEQRVAADVRAALVGQVTSVSAATIRDDDLIATETVRVRLTIEKKGLAKSLELIVSLGSVTTV